MLSEGVGPGASLCVGWWLTSTGAEQYVKEVSKRKASLNTHANNLEHLESRAGEMARGGRR